MLSFVNWTTVLRSNFSVNTRLPIITSEEILARKIKINVSFFLLTVFEIMS